MSRGYAARPAFNLNLKSVIFSSAAAGGKSSGTAGAASLKAVDTKNVSAWKLTLSDDAHKNFKATKTSFDGSTCKFSYSGAKTGSNEYISAIVTDSTGKTIKYYGNVLKVSAASGSASINLSGKLSSNDKLYIFQEQLNGDYKTDYASALCEMNVSQSGGGGTQTGTWKKDSKGWWYKRADGTYPKNKWEKIDGKWYHFDDKGYMQTGWFKEGGKWYYLKPSGVMATGWTQVGSKWYYMDSKGAMQTGWQKIGGKWYYFDSSGVMKTGWLQQGSTWYYLKSSGEMATGWQKISGKWYFFETSGKMLANTSRKIGNKTYKFNASGVCTNP